MSNKIKEVSNSKTLQTWSRGKSKQRPTSPDECRTPNLSKLHPCVEYGHKFEFRRFDPHYGCCKVCGTELIS